MSTEKLSSISSVGEIRGFFDLLLPGVFVLLHAWLVAYSIADQSARAAIGSISLSPATIITIAVPAGYLVGLALRMLRTGLADGWSVRFVLRFASGRSFHRMDESGKEGKTGSGLRPREEVLAERFPYPILMHDRVREHLPMEALEFFETTWAPGKPFIQTVTVFTFEFWKVLLASVDRSAAREAYLLEVSVRLAAHMCYALIMCISMLLPAVVISALWTHGPTAQMAFLAAVECVLVLIVIYNLRFFRMGEVEHVFAMCFKNRAAIKAKLGAG